MGNVVLVVVQGVAELDFELKNVDDLDLVVVGKLVEFPLRQRDDILVKVLLGSVTVVSASGSSSAGCLGKGRWWSEWGVPTGTSGMGC